MRLPYLKQATVRLSSCLGNHSVRYHATTSTSNNQEASSAPIGRIENILILGAGLMGSGIAQSCASSGQFKSVILHDISLIQLSKARERILANLSRPSASPIDNVECILSRIHLSTKYATSAASTRHLLVIEAIPESLEAKQRLFTDLNSRFASNDAAIFTTCSASLAREDICKYFDAKQRFAGINFNPEPSMKMVKIIRTVDTDATTIRLLQRFVADIDKVCIVSSSESIAQTAG